MMEKNNTYMQYLCARLKNAVSKMNLQYIDKMYEIRLRISRPVAIIFGGGIKYLAENGELTYTIKDNTIIMTDKEIQEMFEAICQYSVHSFHREISNGFITVQGGHRIGICGTAVFSGNDINSIKNISGLNFRIARQVFNCSDEIYHNIYGGGIHSLLIAGLPSSGKTTILRDLCRHLGNKYKVSVIDERGEIGAVYKGIPQNDIGINTDVFDGYNKSDGIETAVRVMSPQIIVCDEIGNINDSKALMTAVNSGVKIIATVHADSMENIIEKAFDIKSFEYIVFLDNENIGRLKKIIRTDEYVKSSRMRINNNDNCDDRKLFFVSTE